MATIIVGTNSYNTVAEFNTYLTDRGLSVTGDETELLIKAMDYIENRMFKGERYIYTQDLEFPRTFYLITDTAGKTPVRVKKAQLVAAYLIDQGEVLNPVIEREIKKEKVGPVETEYMDRAAPKNIYPEITDLLHLYLESSGISFNLYR